MKKVVKTGVNWKRKQQLRTKRMVQDFRMNTPAAREVAVAVAVVVEEEVVIGIAIAIAITVLESGKEETKVAVVQIRKRRWNSPVLGMINDAEKRALKENRIKSLVNSVGI